MEYYYEVRNIEVPVPIESNKIYLDAYLNYTLNSLTTIQHIITPKEIKYIYFRLDNENRDIKVYGIQVLFHIVKLY